MKITPYQLTMLTFAYMFSGFFLGGVRNFSMVAASFLALCLYAFAGYRGVHTEKRSFAHFLSVMVSPRWEKLLHLAMLVLMGIQFVSALVTVSEHIHILSGFLPLWVIGLSLIFMALFASRRGIFTVGRLSELLLFLLIPLLVTRPFLSFVPAFRDVPMTWEGDIDFVSIAPIFYLLSRTVTAGDPSASHSLAASRGDIKNRARYVTLFLLAGGLLAVSVYGFLFLFEVHAGDVLLRLFLWCASFIRLAVLGTVFGDLAAESPFSAGKESKIPY